MKLLQLAAYDSPQPQHHEHAMLLRQNRWKLYGPTSSTKHSEYKYRQDVAIKSSASPEFIDDDDRQWEQFLSLTPSKASKRLVERRESSLQCYSKDRLNKTSSCERMDIALSSSLTMTDCQSELSDSSDQSLQSQDSDSMDFADEEDPSNLSRARDSLLGTGGIRRECPIDEINRQVDVRIINAKTLIDELLAVLGCHEIDFRVNGEVNEEMTFEYYNNACCSIQSQRSTLGQFKSLPPVRSVTVKSPKSVLKRSCSNISSSSDDMQEAENQDIKRSVSFSKLQIREFLSVELSDNPSCSAGPPIQLGWEYEDLTDIDVDHYEQFRIPHRKRSLKEMILPNHVRNYLLLNESRYTKAEVSDAIRQVEQFRRGRMDQEHEEKSKFRLKDIFHEIGSIINDMFSFGF